MTLMVVQYNVLSTQSGSSFTQVSIDFESVFATVYYLMEKNPEAHFWTTYQERSATRSIAYLLDRWNMESTPIPLTDFQSDDTLTAAVNEVSLFDIQLKRNKTP
eukprot:m.21845 g.21845  ORF g.21845 m.21845 type:complete len:104 (+) comp28235_c0_seq1:419-730(+)